MHTADVPDVLSGQIPDNRSVKIFRLIWKEDTDA